MPAAHIHSIVMPPASSGIAGQCGHGATHGIRIATIMPPTVHPIMPSTGIQGIRMPATSTIALETADVGHPTLHCTCHTCTPIRNGGTVIFSSDHEMFTGLIYNE